LNSDIQLLTQANAILSKCGRKQYFQGQSAVPIKRDFLIQTAFSVAPVTPTNTIVKEITGDAPWVLRAISSTSQVTTALNLQIKLPNGKFLLSNLQDVLQFAGYGSYKYLVTKEVLCQPGSQIQLTIQDTNLALAQSFAILFEGAYLYFLKGFSPALGGSSGDASRILGNPNQNILAPCWAQGYGPSTPEGCEDKEYIYTAYPLPSQPSIQQQAIVALSIPNTTMSVQIDNGSDFILRRMLFDVQADATVTTVGAFQIRARTGNGYELSNDYFDMAQYVGSSQWAKDWTIAAGDQVFFDVSLTDAVGTGNMYLSIYLEGAKRVKR
jgi:hypothetical protein